jgi:hypothetical protein
LHKSGTRSALVLTALLSKLVSLDARLAEILVSSRTPAELRDRLVLPDTLPSYLTKHVIVEELLMRGLLVGPTESEDEHFEMLRAYILAISGETDMAHAADTLRATSIVPVNSIRDSQVLAIPLLARLKLILQQAA